MNLGIKHVHIDNRALLFPKAISRPKRMVVLRYFIYITSFDITPVTSYVHFATSEYIVSALSYNGVFNLCAWRCTP